jgi:hypothetical protein
MFRSIHASAVLALVSLASIAGPAAAKPWDFIHVDDMDVTLCNNGCGITLAELGWGLLVNTGPTGITASELFGTTYEVVSTNPDFRLIPFVNNPGPTITPIQPDEAIGSIVGGNGLLLPLLEPGETHRNTPYQVFAFQVERTGLSNGPVDFYVAMVMAGERANFVVHADFSAGEHAITFVHASRTSSVPLPTPVVHTTWGKIKAIYR